MKRTSKDFWLTLCQFQRAVVNEKHRAYSAKSWVLQRRIQIRQSNPSGTVSKMFGLTEGAHLPVNAGISAMGADEQTMTLSSKQYEQLGYPVKKLQVYAGTTIVGFPTRPEICRLGMGDKLVTAAEATPEEQFIYLQLVREVLDHRR
jgi:hypothetical protein